MAEAREKRMDEEEAWRDFAAVLDEVVQTRRRVIVERSGRPAVMIVPFEEPAGEADSGLSPGQQLAAMIGFGGEEGDRLYDEMPALLAEVRSEMPRDVPEFDE